MSTNVQELRAEIERLLEVINEDRQREKTMTAHIERQSKEIKLMTNEMEVMRQELEKAYNNKLWAATY